MLQCVGVYHCSLISSLVPFVFRAFFIDKRSYVCSFRLSQISTVLVASHITLQVGVYTYLKSHPVANQNLASSGTILMHPTVKLYWYTWEFLSLVN
jgi:hypothetical protein